MLMILILKDKSRQKLYKNIPIYNTRYETSDGVRPFYINFNKTNEYVEKKIIKMKLNSITKHGIKSSILLG